MDWKDALSALAGDMPAPDQSDAPDTPSAPAELPRQTLTIVYERKGRKGKPATIVTGFDWPDPDVAQLLSKLQSRLATGGSARGGEMLLQGDCRTRLAQLLRDMGHTVKGG